MMQSAVVPRPDTTDRLVAATAANLAGWHDLHVRALGLRSEWVDGSWLSPDPLPHMFFSAISVRPGADPVGIAARTPRTRWTAVCDPWSELGLGRYGYAVDGDHAWMARDAGDGRPETWTRSGATGQPATDLTIGPVVDEDGLADFERAAARGFGVEEPPRASWHGPGLLVEARMQIWRGRVDGRTVAVSMGFAHAGVLGIYGVATVPEARRRGYGSALTLHAITNGPDLPQVLQPSAMAEPMYTRLGFHRFTAFRSWERAARPGLPL